MQVQNTAITNIDIIFVSVGPLEHSHLAVEFQLYWLHQQCVPTTYMLQESAATPRLMLQVLSPMQLLCTLVIVYTLQPGTSNSNAILTSELCGVACQVCHV